MAEQYRNSNSMPSTDPPLTEPWVNQWVDQWVTCVHQAKETTQASLGDFDRSIDPQAWRQQWFDTLGENTDVLLRSKPFLQAMKAHIDAMIQAKRCENALHANALHANALRGDTPRRLSAGASKLGDVTDRVGDWESSVQSRLAQLEQRVAALDGQADARPHVAGWDRFLDALRIARTAPQPSLGATRHDVLYEEGSLRLLRYQPETIRFAEPILICFALVNRPYILDLQPDRSVVRRLLAGGFEVYLIDWGIPTEADRSLRLRDYVNRFLRNVTDRVCELSGTPHLNLLGYCMGGTLSTIFTSIHPERVRNLILMATPIDFGDEAGLLNVWAREEHFDVDQLIDTFGNCPGEFLQHCFQLMKPVRNFAEKYLTFCDKLDDAGFLDNFFALERWASDSIPIAGETFREYVKALYQQNQLVQGQMSLDGASVQLDKITCPLLLLIAEQDHLVPPESSLALRRHVRSREVESLSIAAGHIGLAVSSKAHRRLWPQATNWIAGHSTERL